MKILFWGKPPTPVKVQPPKWKIKQCFMCKSCLVVLGEDCYEGKTVLGISAYYVDCPVCGHSIYVSNMYKDQL